MGGSNNMSDTTSIGRLREAISLSPSADDAFIDLASSWLELQPLDHGHLVASTSEDLSRITLYAAGDPAVFAHAPQGRVIRTRRTISTNISVTNGIDLLLSKSG